jgi:3-deoxy-7-phosphoheptulonate synthase
MNTRSNPEDDGWYDTAMEQRRAAMPSDRTSRTDDARIKDITVLPPPEHLIRFFPIGGTPVESLIASTRRNIQDIMSGDDDRMLVVIGPCSIHDPAAAIDYARLFRKTAHHSRLERLDQ